ncbi:MAG TPA: XRE family transcriptional regulator [Thermodesulfobacteriota bacterium]
MEKEKTTLGERIRQVREELLKLNQADFAKKIGFSRLATISDYETDKRSPDIAALRKIALLGNVTLDWLLTGQGTASLSEARAPFALSEDRPPYRRDFAEVKVYDPVTAGPPSVFPASEPIDAIMVPERDYEAGRIAIRVNGDGMRPGIVDGAVAGIDTGFKQIVSGRIYAVWLNFEGVTLKRVFAHPDRIVLKPDNPSFPEVALFTAGPKEDFLIGRLAWLYQRY